MTYQHLPTNLPALLRKHGLKVVEVPGWLTRGRPAETGEFKPAGVLIHHTAMGKSVPDQKSVHILAIDGRPDLPAPLSQFGVSRDGTVHIIASGRCNHAGVAKPSGTMAGGDGNALYVGIEVFNDGKGEVYPKVQYDAVVLLAAALTHEVTHNSVQTVRGHKETSVTGKPDPLYNMNTFRGLVALKLKLMQNPPAPPKPLTRGAHIDHAIADLRAAQKLASGTRLLRIKAALASLISIRPR